MSGKVARYAILFILISLLILAGYFYWKHQERYPSTDDAYIKAHEINIAAQVNGKVGQVFVHNQQTVSKNTVLFTIDQKPFLIAYKKAQANLQNTKLQIVAAENTVNTAAAELAQRQAQLIDIQKKYNRIMILVKKGYYSRSGGDDMVSQLNVAKQAVIAAENNLAEAKAKRGATGDQNAQVELAQAEVAQAKLNLGYTTVVAPADGKLAQFTLRSGQTVTAYQALFTLVDDHQWWAMANMKETDLQRVRAGETVTVNVDMYPSHPFKGVVKSIAAGSGSSFDLLPPENATGNWVKVTQRFPVRIQIINPNPQFPLRIGASCSVAIDTANHSLSEAKR